MSFFDGIETAAPIEVFHMNRLFMEDSHPNKVNLTIGAYRTEEGTPWVLPVVREAERRLAADETLNHEYHPVLGFEAFCRAATRFVLGDDSPALRDGRATGVQCLSGTGSLRVAAETMTRLLGSTIVYMSKPTWGNHKLVFKNAGFAEQREYRYWDQQERKVDIDAMLQDLETAPERAVVLLHGCAHNPTGMDPSEQQWRQICQVIKKRRLLTLFDLAYQGFASGNPDRDAWAVRHFVSEGVELFVTQSFAKNFGLYNERVGNLTIVSSNASNLAALRSQISLIIRANWSNPPNHGARVVEMVLSDEAMRRQWFGHIEHMSARIRTMRLALRGGLEALGTPGTWSHVTEQIGMFSYTGLTPEQVNHLVSKHRVYLLKDGRINCCGLTTKNVDYVARAIDDAVRTVSHI